MHIWFSPATRSARKCRLLSRLGHLGLSGTAQFGSLLILSILLSLMPSAHAEPGLPNARPIAPFLDGVLPESTPGTESNTMDAVDGVEWRTVEYFPGVKFIEPIRLVEHPTQNSLIVVGKDGIGTLITNTPGATDTREFFNIQPIMFGNPGVGEGGISDFAFHPEFGRPGSPNARYVYLTYYWSPVNSGTFSDDNGLDGYNRLSRFEIINGRMDLSTELVMINQYDRAWWHLGMNIEFGPEDGYLYLSLGDESVTDCCDRRDSTQRLDGGFWSGILRIDVDNDPDTSHAIRRQPRHPVVDPTRNGRLWPRSFTQGYSIPNDNPFVSADGANLEEFYALGLRHPWTMWFDSVTGELWVGDVGHHAREEVNIVENGDNLQWPYREGTEVRRDRPPAMLFGNEKPPVFEYSHDVGDSVIGAGVYRGSRYPELQGKFLFSDFTDGPLWTATRTATGVDVERIGTVTSGWGSGIVGYLLDSNGRILMLRTRGGQRPSVVQELIRVGGNGDGTTGLEQAPEFLSQTGAFNDLSTLETVDGCLPYDLNVPFWSDGAEKYRWVCIPNDGDPDSDLEQIQFSQDGVWDFPVGTVFIKHFEMRADARNPDSSFRLETRFLVNTANGYYGLSYRWDTQEDARLVAADGETWNFRQRTADGRVDRVWEYPSRNQCLECHLEVSGGALGASTRQWNRSFVYPSTGMASNQLETFNHIGLFSPSLDVERITSSATTLTPTTDASASLQERARGYLDSNCSSCHRPGGVLAAFDARATTALSDQGLINGDLQDTYEIPGERVIVPGSPEQSILFHRANRLDSLSMPPVGKRLIDTEGMQLLESWISSMDPSSDIDGDGTPDFLDAFPEDMSESEDSDGDGIGNNTDDYPLDANNDEDSDGIGAEADNCPTIFNADQQDVDGDGVGDACTDGVRNDTLAGNGSFGGSSGGSGALSSMALLSLFSMILIRLARRRGFVTAAPGMARRGPADGPLARPVSESR